MEEKKEIKVSLKVALTIIIIFIIVIITGGYIYSITNKKESDIEVKIEPVSNNIDVEIYKNEKYYIIKDDYSGEYDLQLTSLSEYYDNRVEIMKKFQQRTVMSYKEYTEYCKEWNFKQKYNDSSKNYIVFSYLEIGAPNIDARLATVEYKNDEVLLYIWDDSNGDVLDISAYMVVIPTTENINNVSIQNVYTKEEFNNIKRNNIPDTTVDKPIIYLYPEKEIEISVKLGYPERVTCSYPEYKDGWNVIAKPDGTLIDTKTGRNLYALYWEGINSKQSNITDGFVVKGNDTISFLEEKLEVLGLNEKEAEEFIVYWLPRLQENEFNYIRFAGIDEINDSMPLDFSIKPDTLIRVWMEFKGLDNYIKVPEQKLDSTKREGFTVVEWGGTELK